MSTLWQRWHAELEALPALAGEWNPGEAEKFLDSIQGLLARKRALRDSALKLVDEIKDVHVRYEELLAFFDIESAYLGWSAANCPPEQIDEVRTALAAWREVLEMYAGSLPLAAAQRLSYVSLQILTTEAQSAAAAILPGFRSLDARLSPPSAVHAGASSKAA